MLLSSQLGMLLPQAHPRTARHRDQQSITAFSSGTPSGCMLCPCAWLHLHYRQATRANLADVLHAACACCSSCRHGPKQVNDRYPVRLSAWHTYVHALHCIPSSLYGRQCLHLVLSLHWHGHQQYTSANYRSCLAPEAPLLMLQPHQLCEAYCRAFQAVPYMSLSA